MNARLTLRARDEQARRAVGAARLRSAPARVTASRTTASPRHTSRRYDVDEPIAALNRLRNRAAHHQHLLSDDLPTRHV